MSKINSFDILKEMSDRDNDRLNNPSLIMFPGDNIRKIYVGKKGWGNITIAIDNKTAQDYILGKRRINIVLLAYDLDEFRNVREELMRAIPSQKPNELHIEDGEP